MKLSTTPTREDLRRTAEDILVELQTDLVRGIKISNSTAVMVWRPGDEDGAIDFFYRKRDSEEIAVKKSNALKNGWNAAVEVLVDSLSESGGKFARFQ